ncbi:hypothetical protein Q5P01_002793 [Channa striata]|uniref:Immunoglobulin V-set domain-containing protein n=1 Tax=Channa striata TaxID=64152 RepID=A0AA88NPU9_CHASR|nr:hypothetical protein Q5P01_002793 [Channa striata]
MNKEIMMWIILLIGLSSFVSGLTEQEDGSFRWDTKTNTKLSLMDLNCLFLSDPPKVLYQMINGVEYPESQSEQFAGRVQLDRDALRDGQIRLHLSTVTAEDSGNYRCDLAFNYDKNTGTWSLLDTKTFVLTVSRTIDGDNSEVSLNTLKSGSEMPEGEAQTRKSIQGICFSGFIYTRSTCNSHGGSWEIALPRSCEERSEKGGSQCPDWSKK